MSPSPDDATDKPLVAAPEPPAAPAAANADATVTAESNTAPAADLAPVPSPPPDLKTPRPAQRGEVAEHREAGEGLPRFTAEGSGPPDAGTVEEPLDPFPDQREPPPPHVLLYTVFALLCAGIALWLVLAWSGYKEKYSQQTEGWRLGTIKMLEITLIKDDKKNLACASDRLFGDVHCGFRRDGQPYGTKAEDDPKVLQPFNTVKNELFLAAGLWQAPVLKEPLPSERFTVVCNYHILGVLKAVALRWSPTGTFGPADQSIAVGTLSDCVIPQ